MPGRTTTKPETTPAGEPAPTPAEEVEPTAPPAPAPEPAPEGPLTSRRRTLFGDAEFPLSVGEAISEVTRRVPAITKDKTASQGGSFKYRGIDDVLEALHPLLGEVGLVVMPGTVVREVWETRATSSGGTLNVARLLVRFRFVGPDGSELDAEVWGEGGDSGDKATQKAHSQAYKTLCLETFSIPTEESAAAEPDATNPASRPFTAEEQERAGRAWEAALAAETVEALAGVRHRASALLPVPVRMADESLVPLAALFDSRLSAIQGDAARDAAAAAGGSA